MTDDKPKKVGRLHKRNDSTIVEALRPLAVSIDSLHHDAANARRHGERNLDAIRASLAQFGQRKPIVVQRDGMIVRAGNGTLEAARALGWTEIAAVIIVEDGTTAAQFAIADNRTAELAEWDNETLATLLDGWDAQTNASLGFDQDDVDQLLERLAPHVDVQEDEVPEPPADPITKPGDLWILGKHRLLCGDSTSAEDVKRLFDGATATMLHADPPYGMGKEKDGVANDNLYREKLDAFQMNWWQAWRPHLPNNGSVYIWGNAPDLWRLWYCGGLSELERMTIRNEIVWSKSNAFGMSSKDSRCYPPETERCLFFMLGDQGFNTNADNYWEGWEPIRSYLDGERKRSGLTTDQCNKICGKQNMTQAAFTKGGFRLILREDYEKLRDATHGGAFKREYDDLKQEYDDLKQEYDDLRAYFDNTHDNMTDVWSFGRVVGEDRYGHATPKPVKMVARSIKSSSKEGDVIAAPFGGTGPELIAAEQLGRIYYGMEISPQYCDVIVQRWEQLTGKKAELDNGN